MNSEIFNELEKSKSILTEIGNDPVFEPPDGYFDKMQSQVLQKIHESGRSNRLVNFVTKHKIVIAASVIILLAVAAIRFSMEKNTIGDSITSEEAFYYLEDNIDNLDIYDLSQYLDNNDIYITGEDIITNQELDFYIQDNIDEIQEEYLYN